MKEFLVFFFLTSLSGSFTIALLTVAVVNIAVAWLCDALRKQVTLPSILKTYSQVTVCKAGCFSSVQISFPHHSGKASVFFFFSCSLSQHQILAWWWASGLLGDPCTWRLDGRLRHLPSPESQSTQTTQPVPLSLRAPASLHHCGIASLCGDPNVRAEASGTEHWVAKAPFHHLRGVRHFLVYCDCHISPKLSRHMSFIKAPLFC